MEYVEKKCPQCCKKYKSYPAFKDWCEYCEWNLKKEEFFLNGRKQSVYDKIVRKIGDRYSKNLFQEIINQEIVKPKRSFVSVITVLAGIVSIFSWLLLLIIGIYLLTLYPNLFAITLGVIVLATAVYLRPIVPEIPEHFLNREKMPVLFDVVDEINTKLGGSPIDLIVLNHEFNASMSYVGLKRKRVLTLGYPLLYLLNKQELVCLIGHELAHNVNNDPTRGYFHYYAADMLLNWYFLISPDYVMSWDDINYLLKLGAVPLYVLMWCISRTILGVFYIYYWMIHKESQKAEYYADFLEAKIGGKEASLSLSQKLYCGNVLEYVQQMAVLNPGGKGIMEYLVEFVSTLPEKERTRIGLLMNSVESRIDSTHPPTKYRMEFIDRKGNTQPEYVLDERKFQDIRQELYQYHTEIENKLMDEYRLYIHQYSY